MQILLEKFSKGDKLMEAYDTEEDAAGLYVNRSHNHASLTSFSSSLCIPSEPFEINDEIIYFHPILFQTSKKCLVELFKYISSNMKIGEDLELYCCWAHGQERFFACSNKRIRPRDCINKIRRAAKIATSVGTSLCQGTRTCPIT